MLEGTFVTVTGISHYNGVRPYEIGKMLVCQKEPSNPFDTEAIMVLDKGNHKVGYIANGTNTKLNGTMSAGRLYDRLGDFCVIEVCFSTKKEVICQVIDFDCKNGDLLNEFLEPDDDEDCDYDFDNDFDDDFR